MKIAVLSGKGGAGKTFLAVNLAASLGNAAYVDCDVEEPNGHLFLKPENITETTVSQRIPAFDPERCTGCRKCVDFCRFNALIYIKKVPMLFTEVCHSCGGCALVCPQKAIRETDRPIGIVRDGTHGETRVITGILNPGEASGVALIQQGLRLAEREKNVIIDCPPGSACSVQESIQEADYCILAAEPTAFGFHNFQMVHELVQLHKKPCGVVINKEDEPYPPLDAYCREHSLPILMRIPYDRQLGSRLARGELACEKIPELKAALWNMAHRIGGGRL